MALAGAMSDGVVTIRPSSTADVPVLVAGRDHESRRFLGDGDPQPCPVACIAVGDVVVGWVDYDHDRPWLGPDEVNLGDNVFPPFRGNGYGTRTVRLLLQHLATETSWKVATLLIHPENHRSLALAARAGFERVGDLDGNPYWKLAVQEAAPPSDLGMKMFESP